MKYGLSSMASDFGNQFYCTAVLIGLVYTSKEEKPTAAASERGFGIQVRQDYHRRCRIAIAAAVAAATAAAAAIASS